MRNICKNLVISLIFQRSERNWKWLDAKMGYGLADYWLAKIGKQIEKEPKRIKESTPLPRETDDPRKKMLLRETTKKLLKNKVKRANDASLSNESDLPLCSCQLFSFIMDVEEEATIQDVIMTPHVLQFSYLTLAYNILFKYLSFYTNFHYFGTFEKQRTDMLSYRDARTHLESGACDVTDHHDARKSHNPTKKSSKPTV